MEQRTGQQNRALHKWLEMVAEALDREGHTLQNVVEQIQRTEIRPTKENLKEVMWKPMQKALYNTSSTTELTTAQVDKVYEMLNYFIGTNFKIHVPFPSDDETTRSN